MKSIKSLILHASSNCLIQYIAAINKSLNNPIHSANYMPEFWIVAHLMRELGEHGYAAIPEVRPRLMDDFVENEHDLSIPNITDARGAPAISPFLRQHPRGRLDLLVARQKGSTNALIAEAAIEVKGAASNWGDCYSDIDRLKSLRSELKDSPMDILFLYITRTMAFETFENEKKKLAEYANLQKEKQDSKEITTKPIRGETGKHYALILSF